MKTKLGSRALIIGLGIGLIATAICFVSINGLLRQQQSAEDWVDHSIDVLGTATMLDADLAIVVSEGRVFIIGKGANITPFNAAAIKVAGDIANLRALTSDNPVQQATLDRIEPLVVARVALLRDLNQRLQAGGVDNGSRLVGISQANTALMDQIFVATEELKAEERHLLGERLSAAHNAAKLLADFLIGYGLLTAASAFFMTSLLMGRTRERVLDRANTALKRLSRHLVRARNVAEEASRAKSRFLAGMSHELRTPLNGILGYAYLLRIEGRLTAAQGARIDAMLEAGKHLLEMITCVLDLSEIEADHLLLRPVDVDVYAIGTACLDLVRPMVEAKGLALSIAVAPDTPLHLVADPTRLRQILLNLLGNAAKFTAHGSVELRLGNAADRSALRIEVADTGPGVPTEQRKRLFQDFERLETEVTRTAEGAGLGLALSSRLAKLMGGSLGYDDNPFGGSVFWLELPLDIVVISAPAVALDLDVLDAETGVARVQVLQDRVLNVLVVDDVLMNRDIAGSFLRSAGHTAVCVEGGAEAVAAVVTTDFDVVLMDVRMPGMDGLEATRRIRTLDGVRGQVPIVALTAQAFAEQVAECRKAGMNNHLTKPFDPNTLLAAVRQAFIAGRTHDEALPLSPQVVLPDILAIAVSGLEIPVLDQAAFERTTSFLPPETVASYLQTIVDLGDRVMRRLNASEHSGDELADAAHMLAGSAGMLGFSRLAAVSRCFEQAIQSESMEAPTLANSLAATLKVTLPVLQNLEPVGVEGAR